MLSVVVRTFPVRLAAGDAQSVISHGTYNLQMSSLVMRLRTTSMTLRQRSIRLGSDTARQSSLLCGASSCLSATRRFASTRLWILGFAGNHRALSGYVLRKSVRAGEFSTAVIYPRDGCAGGV